MPHICSLVTLHVYTHPHLYTAGLIPSCLPNLVPTPLVYTTLDTFILRRSTYATHDSCGTHIFQFPLDITEHWDPFGMVPMPLDGPSHVLTLRDPTPSLPPRYPSCCSLHYLDTDFAICLPLFLCVTCLFHYPTHTTPTHGFTFCYASCGLPHTPLVTVAFTYYTLNSLFPIPVCTDYPFTRPDSCDPGDYGPDRLLFCCSAREVFLPLPLDDPPYTFPHGLPRPYPARPDCLPLHPIGLTFVPRPYGSHIPVTGLLLPRVIGPTRCHTVYLARTFPLVCSRSVPLPRVTHIWPMPPCPPLVPTPHTRCLPPFPGGRLPIALLLIVGQCPHCLCPACHTPHLAVIAHATVPTYRTPDITLAPHTPDLVTGHFTFGPVRSHFTPIYTFLALLVTLFVVSIPQLPGAHVYC